MARRHHRPNDSFLPILGDFLSEKVSTRTTVEHLAPANLEDGEKDGFPTKWDVVLTSARQQPQHHEKIAELLNAMRELAIEKDAKAKAAPFNRKPWPDFYVLAREFNYEWNGLSIPEEPAEKREQVMEEFINVNKFGAVLMKRDPPVVNIALQALWTMRSGLETPLRRSEPYDIAGMYVMAAAAWIMIVGSEIYSWDTIYRHGGVHGRPGSGGPLWEGVHGFCPERWGLWKRRFGELATANELSEDCRRLAMEAKTKMEQIEAESLKKK